MEIIFSKDNDWLAKWDDFVQNENRASHLLLSDWNKAFQSYGFDFEIGLLVENDKIIGGFSAVIAKALFFKFYIIPFGPIVSLGYESKLNGLIEKVLERAKLYKSCYCHITIPVNTNGNKHLFRELPLLPILNNVQKGHLFKFVYSSNGLNWKSVNNFTNEEELLSSFRASVRRYIRSSERKELELRFLESEKDVKLAYNLCLENAKNHNYSLRDWSSFKETLLTMIENKKAKFLGAFYENDIKGAALIVKAGNYYTYILGGTKKQKPDFLAGHFLHWQAIKLSFSEKLSGYNISLGGSKGVVDLKNSYADGQIYFENSKYHWVLKPTYFKLYLFFEKKLKNNKKLISKLLNHIKR
ncbi:peptidoglycan bridge formation glycyltransferase FemA/FemB family protein [Flavobacterium piscinae]|uniref:Peptidoglycan bridge formation glycyltransferase FemA/FemB family protein n=1 Tax=Flavobacterium piscinae TaxID=2506424 RepID=A0A4Q1KWX2_9FLAO|nr:peptidoglycan bridge formation glycyltransferase FemA/FemB family protein [Flavobacterium piscinae]RXR34667.1 peptidoglycan bridge formation glycyltransferase FemA/FemB family protein [Flavobacterium piscinae]